MATILRAQPKNILDLGCGAGVYLPLSGMFPNIATTVLIMRKILSQLQSGRIQM